MELSLSLCREVSSLNLRENADGSSISALQSRQRCLRPCVPAFTDQAAKRRGSLVYEHKDDIFALLIN